MLTLLSIYQYPFSEQRRHFQQLHPESTTEEIDDLMRTAWETLEKKTKLRYMTRASDATRDENKHSTLTIVNTGNKSPCYAFPKDFFFHFRNVSKYFNWISKNIL